MTPFRRPLDDRAALFIVKTALHVKVISFLSTVQQLVLTAGHLWSRFGRRFYHALKTANYTKSDSGPSIILSSIHVESELTIVLSLPEIKHHYADKAMQMIYSVEASAVENHP